VCVYTAGRLESGSFTAILGPSGSGKTTLIDCLALRNRDFEGGLRLNGQSLTGHFFGMAGKLLLSPPKAGIESRSWSVE